MSNRSKTTAGQRFMDILKEAAEKKRQLDEAKAAENGESFNPPEQLPLPTCQIVREESFQWIWEAIPNKAHVHLWYKKVDGDWIVELFTVQSATLLFLDESKAIGEALLAAYAYQFHWKDHVADYMIGDKIIVNPLSPPNKGGRDTPNIFADIPDTFVPTVAPITGDSKECCCGEPDNEGSVHRKDGPCYNKELERE